MLRRTPEMLHFLASYEVLKRDALKMFEYLEPDFANLNAFSHRLFELLLRSSTEVESLCKAVFSANRVALSKANIIRFSDLEGPMKLSEYEISFTNYALPIICPFRAFRNAERDKRSPPWYKSYNLAKHDRARQFKEASLDNVLNALGGVLVLLSAQIGPISDTSLQLAADGWNRVVGGVISVRTLPTWPEAERYEFDWSALSQTAEPFQYCPIPQRP